jgi:hypothetical protein
MMDERKQQILRWLIALVWLINGLFCKVLNLVPRHQEIVSRVLGIDNARIITLIIGLLETAMAVWVISGIKTRLNAIVQIFIILTMNIIEFIKASDLLLWGKLNAFFAFLFILVIYYNEFHLNKKIAY